MLKHPAWCLVIIGVLIAGIELVWRTGVAICAIYPWLGNSAPSVPSPPSHEISTADFPFRVVVRQSITHWT